MNERLIVVMIHKSERWKSNQKKNLVKKKKNFLGQREVRIEILSYTNKQHKKKQERKKGRKGRVLSQYMQQTHQTYYKLF